MARNNTVLFVNTEITVTACWAWKGFCDACGNADALRRMNERMQNPQNRFSAVMHGCGMVWNARQHGSAHSAARARRAAQLNRRDIRRFRSQSTRYKIYEGESVR